MRNFTRETRKTLPSLLHQEEEMFEKERQWYMENNRYPVKLFGQWVVNLAKEVNLQVLVTRQCNANCGFCIEKSSPRVRVEPTLLPTVEEVMRSYVEQGIHPTVSITGGEPTLEPETCEGVIELAGKYGLRVNLNTNGRGLMAIPLVKYPSLRVNLSRHHHIWAAEIFKVASMVYPLITTQTTMQCCLLKGYIDSSATVREYLNAFRDSSCGGYSFRGLSALDSTKEYGEVTPYVRSKAVHPATLANQFFRDPEMTFIQQKIGDHFWYEIYRWFGKVIRVTYSNFDFLQRMEKEEKEPFSRATIVGPQGEVWTGWSQKTRLK